MLSFLKRNKERKIKNIINIIVPGILIFMGIMMMIFPWLGVNNAKILLYVVFSIYAGIKMVEYIITRNQNDYENLFTSIACTLAAISGFKFSSDNYNTALVLSITLASWTGIMAIIKLIKLDYYHDRENGMFYVNVVTFGIFILLGLLTSINLYFNATVQTIMIGFFFIINGILTLAEQSIRVLVSRNALKIKDTK